MQLGVKVLELPDFVVKSAVYNCKRIQSAAHEVLSTWLKQQTNRHEAYTNLITSLQESEMNQLAAQLQTWAEGVKSNITSLSEKRRYSFDLAMIWDMKDVLFSETKL